MTNKKSTKKALITSALCLLLCMSMLVGTTFAWFTDEVKSGTNIIAAGNLDIELYHSDDNATDEKVNSGTKLFDDVSPKLWEPGAVAYEILTVKNEGTLALKYNLAFHALNATVVNDKSLADALKVAVVDEAKLTDRESAIAAGNEAGWSNLASFDLPGTLAAEASETYGIVIYWLPTANDNDFNMNNENQGKTLSVELGVHLTATQLMSENDSYGPDYDEDAEFVLIKTADDLAAALTSGDEYINVILGSDINLPIGSLGTITGGSGEYKLGGENTKAINVDLNGHKLNITTTYWSNLGAKNNDAVITFANGTMTSSQATGTWNSYDLTFSNCKFAFENVVFGKAIALESDAVLKNVTVSETHDYYAIWISAKGQTVEIDGLTVISAGRGIKIDEQYISAPEKVTLKVSNATFNTNNKAAIMVKSAAGADITLSNVNTANTVDPAHAVWVDEDSAAYIDLVTVTGGNKFYEGDVISSSAGLNDAIANGQTEVVLGSGDYALPSVNNGDVTISGSKDTVITVNKPNYSGSDVTFNGVSIKGSGYATGVQHVNTVTYNDATIIGEMCLYGEKVVFNNCTFELNNQYIWTYGAKEVEFINCTFNTNGKAILIYNEGANLVTNVTVTGCTFNASAAAYAGTISNQACAAIEIGSNLATNGHYTLTTSGNTVNGDFSGEWRIKASAGSNVTVNGTDYEAVTLDGVAYVLNGKEVTAK